MNTPVVSPGAAPASTPPVAAGVGVRGPVLIGFAIIVLFFGVFGGWAAVAPLQSAAIATGVVSVDSNRKTVQHLEGGIIDKILVRDGDTVKAGQVLITLDKTRPRATLDLLRGRLLASKALEARLIAERDGMAEIPFPDGMVQRAGETRVVTAMAGQQSIFDGRRKTLRNQVAILGQRTAQYREEIIGLEGQIGAEDTQLGLIAGEVRDVKVLVDKGLARRPRLLALQRQAAEIVGARARNVAAIARAEQNIIESKLRVSELKTKLTNEAVQLLRDEQNNLFDLAERIRAAEDVLNRVEIRSPLNGAVVGLQVHTVGGVISPGASLMDIVPADDRLVIDARIDPADIDVVRAGLEAQVRLTALTQRNNVPMAGRVMWVSADRLIDKTTGMPYYRAKVELIGDIRKVLGDVVLYPGMQAEVMVVTGARTALDYFLRPLLDSFNRAFRDV
jgi:HlyD family type I secretion membrane fusion protein